MGAASKTSVAVALGLGAGFLVGYLIGGRTREATPGRTSVNYRGGKLLVEVDAAGALRDGVASVFKGDAVRVE